MDKSHIYFDNAATTRIDDSVLEAMLPWLSEDYGNASSVHYFGRKARVAIEESRETIAAFIGAKPREIFFVSGGTEANNFLLRSIAEVCRNEYGRSAVVSDMTEHASVTETLKELSAYGYSVRLVPPAPSGIITPSAVDSMMSEAEASAGTTGVSLVSVMHVNNETGAINDIREISQVAHTRGALFHSDAVQSFGKFRIDVNKIGADTLGFSSHKINGPKGIGAVYIKAGTPVKAFVKGGGQERNLRGGTENVAAIVGFGRAVSIAADSLEKNLIHVNAIKQRLAEGIRSIDPEGIRIISSDGESAGIFSPSGMYSPYILSMTFCSEHYRIDPESLLMQFDLNGIALSNGSACSSGSVHPSHVLTAMGLSRPDVNGTVRISLGKFNSTEESETFLEKLRVISRKFRIAS